MINLLDVLIGVSIMEFDLQAMEFSGIAGGESVASAERAKERNGEGNG